MTLKAEPIKATILTVIVEIEGYPAPKVVEFEHNDRVWTVFDPNGRSRASFVGQQCLIELFLFPGQVIESDEKVQRIEFWPHGGEMAMYTVSCWTYA